MRPHLYVLVALLAFSGARAADLTGILSDHLLRKVPPTDSLNLKQGNGPYGFMPVSTQMLQWKNPARLNADMLGFVYLYQLGQDYWTLFISNPRSPMTDYLGATQVTRVGRTPSATPMTIYRIEAGRFKGFLAEDGIHNGTHLLILMTPQMAATSPTLAQYLK